MWQSFSMAYPVWSINLISPSEPCSCDCRVCLMGSRRSEDAMNQDLNRDLPAIQRGLFELIAKIFEQLPKVQLTRPARMIDFLRWLAAMEIVEALPMAPIKRFTGRSSMKHSSTVCWTTLWRPRS